MKLTESTLKRIIKEEIETMRASYDEEDSLGKFNQLLDAAREVRNLDPKALNALKNRIANDLPEDEYEFAMDLLQKIQHSPFYDEE